MRRFVSETLERMPDGVLITDELGRLFMPMKQPNGGWITPLIKEKRLGWYSTNVNPIRRVTHSGVS